MDLTRDVIYRNFLLNDSLVKENVTTGGTGTGISGCIIDNADLSDVDITQFMEKRSEQDGMDAGPVFKGARRIRLSGVLYGLTRPDLYDRRRALRAALDPVLAYLDEPMDKGFQPLYFSEPTDRPDFPGNVIDFRALAIPRALQDPIVRDQLGGVDEDALALQWRTTMICKDPSLMVATPQEYPLEGTGQIDVTLLNRGNYPVPLNMIFAVGTEAGSIRFVVNGTSNLITIPSSTLPRTIRYKGADKILTVQDGTGPENPKLNLLTFDTSKSHPQIPTSEHALSVTASGVTLAAGSQAWIWETFS